MRPTGAAHQGPPAGGQLPRRVTDAKIRVRSNGRAVRGRAGTGQCTVWHQQAAHAHPRAARSGADQADTN